MKKNNIIKMKFGTRILIPVLSLILVLVSCEKIIDLNPYDSVSETTAFTNPELIELSVIGMYNAAQRGYYNNNLRGYPFGAAFVEQGDCRGEDVINTASFYRITYEGTYNTTTANNRYYWEDTYRLINRCNIIIDGVRVAAENGVITTEVANGYEGEARLLRAAAYHELLVMFARPYKHTAGATHAGVPYHDVPFTTQAAIDAGLEKGRETVGFVYGKILDDLNYCEANLPTKSGRTGSTKITRGTKGAAIAYKVRIYQHMWDMDNVITEGLKLVTGTLAGEYALESTPWACFTSNYDNSESIYGMENSATNNPGVNAALASQYKRRQLVCMSPIIWRNPAWLADDLRRNEGDMITTVDGRKYTHKYKDDTNYTDASPMMRYAEVILNLAEAYARKGNVTEGLKYLNMVRDRALADEATQSYVAADFSDNVALLGAILVERRIELNMEGRRWPDIHRLQHCPYFPIDGIPAKLANGMPNPDDFNLGTPYTGPYGVTAFPYDDYRFLWPIPLSEINSNPILATQQNPGY